MAILKSMKLIGDDDIVIPNEATENDLLVVHPSSYLKSLKWSITVANIIEVPFVALLPNFVVQKRILKAFRYQTGGTVLAGKLALERGWAINIGGGFHHCSSDNGGGFCAYADITICLKMLFQHVDGVRKAVIIDLDAHQGNGHERDFAYNSNVYILDLYNADIYPRDKDARRGISKEIKIRTGEKDDRYLMLVKLNYPTILDEFKPDIVIYNAGTDILDGDPLGGLCISAQGVIKRDEIVFKETRFRNIPIVMLTSGGYQKSNAKIIADSIMNLYQKKLIGNEYTATFSSDENLEKLSVKEYTLESHSQDTRYSTFSVEGK
ncbi:Histone deacetylase 11 [Trichoplax sp. H2]|nr:Histone deacetylase 11 [Trichoplax sp. H2]|eukprot:RDD46868.1 Histone deacetylase 11 [Trichoplax sp. H2]